MWTLDLQYLVNRSSLCWIRGVCYRNKCMGKSGQGVSFACDGNRLETGLLHHVCNHSLECNYSLFDFPGKYHPLKEIIQVSDLPPMGFLTWESLMLPMCPSLDSMVAVTRVRGALIVVNSLYDPDGHLAYSEASRSCHR